MGGRLVLLLVALLVTLLVYPLLETFVVVRGLLDVALTLVLLGALYSVSSSRVVFRFVAVLTVAALAGRWLPFLLPGVTVPLFRYGASAGVFAVAAAVILVHVLKIERVTFEHVAGALVAYLLVGLVWAHGYLLLEALSPGSLALGADLAGTERSRFGACVYFSFVTLTTLGYGDMSPVSEAARSLAMTEAVTGQFYIAVLIARLVGMQARRPDSDREPTR